VAITLLGAAVERCRELGILQVLLICDSDNFASIRIMDANGGVLDREGWNESAGRMLRW
jgi:predicted acetyltransferase